MLDVGYMILLMEHQQRSIWVALIGRLVLRWKDRKQPRTRKPSGECGFCKKEVGGTLENEAKAR